MQNTLYIFLIIILASACKSDDNGLDDPNTLLPPVQVNFEINLNLPEFKNLQFVSGTYINSQQGINGVVIYNVDGNQFTAFEITDPNHQVRECSKMTLDGIILTCSCDDKNEYDILTGQRRTNPGEGLGLRRYRIAKNGNKLFVTN